MAISVTIQKIKSARARRISESFSSLEMTADDSEHSPNEMAIFIEGPGHEDAAARIAALINEQAVRRDRPAPLVPPSHPWGEPNDDGPTYDGPDDENEALRMETEQNISLGQAREAAEEERAYNEEDRLGKEAHLRSVRRDDKPWTPHEDEIEEDVAEGRRGVDGEPF